MDMFRAIIANPQLLILLIADALRLIAFYMIAACAAYYTKIVLENPSLTSVILVVFNVGTLIGSLMSKRIVAKLGTKKASIMGTAGLAILLIVLYIVPTQQMIVFVILFVAQIIFGVAYGLTTSMYSMCGTDSEYRTGKSTKGIIMSCSSLAIKIAIALRGMVISAALAYIAYNPDGAITSAAQSGIKLVFLIIPAAFCIISSLVFLLYKINDKDIARMEQEIMKRQKQ